MNDIINDILISPWLSYVIFALYLMMWLTTVAPFVRSIMKLRTRFRIHTGYVTSEKVFLNPSEQDKILKY